MSFRAEPGRAARQGGSRASSTRPRSLRTLEEAAQPPRVNPDNPHSSEFYRAIQFTGRQLIKLHNPLYEQLVSCKQLGANEEGRRRSVQKPLERVDMKYCSAKCASSIRSKFRSWTSRAPRRTRRGRSAHSEYKRAQVQTALRRVMGSLADAPGMSLDSDVALIGTGIAPLVPRAICLSQGKQRSPAESRSRFFPGGLRASARSHSARRPRRYARAPARCRTPSGCSRSCGRIFRARSSTGPARSRLRIASTFTIPRPRTCARAPDSGLEPGHGLRARARSASCSKICTSSARISG